MFVKRLLIVLSALIVTLFPIGNCYAAENIALSQANAWEQNIDVAADMQTDSISCKMPNQTADAIGSGPLTDKEVAVRTALHTGQPTAAAESKTPVPAETAVSAATAAPASTPSSGGLFNFLNKYRIVIYIGGGIGAAIAIGVIIALIIIRNKKKKERKSGDAQSSGNPAFNDKTELLPNSGTGGTFNDNPCIRLRNPGSADQVWDVALTSEVLIGRDTSCQVCLSESSVSRQQCLLYLNGAAYAENLSKSNKTLLNGEPLNVPAEIKTGDKLKCGRITLIVDSLYVSDSHNVGELNKGTRFINI